MQGKYLRGDSVLIRGTKQKGVVKDIQVFGNATMYLVDTRPLNQDAIGKSWYRGHDLIRDY